MTAFLIANLAPIMFATLVIFLLSGFPVAFSLAANGLFFAFVGIQLGLLTPELLQALPNRIFGIMAISPIGFCGIGAIGGAWGADI